MSTDLWTSAADPGLASGGLCLLDPPGDVAVLAGWATHKTRGLELYVLGSNGGGKYAIGDGAVGVASVLGRYVRAARAGSGVLELAAEEPIYNPRNPAGSLGTYRSIGHFEGVLDRAATLVPYRTWVRHHGMRPGDGAKEIKASVLDLATHVLAGWKAPAKVLEAAGEAYLIAHCARGTTP